MFGFNTAFSYLMQGKKVRRALWYPHGFIEVADGQIIDENLEDWFKVSDSKELLADDWELVD